MFPPKGSKGKQGHDLTLVTNVYAPFMLARGLEGVLRRTAEQDGKDGRVRVSWAGSMASFLSRPACGVGWEKDGKEIVGAFEDPEGVYAVSKSANWWFAQEFARRWKGAGVLQNVCPPPSNSAQNFSSSESVRLAD